MERASAKAGKGTAQDRDMTFLSRTLSNKNFYQVLPETENSSNFPQILLFCRKKKSERKFLHWITYFGFDIAVGYFEVATVYFGRGYGACIGSMKGLMGAVRLSMPVALAAARASSVTRLVA